MAGKGRFRRKGNGHPAEFHRFCVLHSFISGFPGGKTPIFDKIYFLFFKAFNVIFKKDI